MPYVLMLLCVNLLQPGGGAGPAEQRGGARPPLWGRPHHGLRALLPAGRRQRHAADGEHNSRVPMALSKPAGPTVALQSGKVQGCSSWCQITAAPLPCLKVLHCWQDDRNLALAADSEVLNIWPTRKLLQKAGQLR